MTIIVDTREKFIERIKEILINIPDAPEVKISCLSKGDYDITNGGRQLRVERKSMNDFVNSFRVLKPRLHEMRLQNEYTALLLEGTYSVQGNMLWVLEGSHMQPRMDYTSYSNFLTHQASAGVWLFHTMCFEETIRRLIAIHDYLPRLNAPNSIKCGNSSEWMMMLPGIGKVTMEKLREQYNSPLEALQCLPTKTIDYLRDW